MKTIATIIHKNNFPLRILDSNGNTLYWEDSNGFWLKYEYDNQGNKIYIENSFGVMQYKR